MYSLNYNLSYAIDNYFEAIVKYPAFYTIIIAMAVLGVVFIANLAAGSNNLKITVAIETICVFLTLYHFGLDLVNHLDSSLNENFLNNICFYFLNANFSLILIGAAFSSSMLEYASKFILSICYLLILANLLFALYISYVIDETLFITLGNIFPMVLVGNIISIGSYIVFIIVMCTNKLSKQYAKKEHLLYR